MIKVEVIENFTLKKYNELKNVVRKSVGKEGELKVGDTFECDEQMAKYLTGDNQLQKVVVKIIEIENKKEPEIVVDPEKPKKENKKSNKKSSKK